MIRTGRMRMQAEPGPVPFILADSPFPEIPRVAGKPFDPAALKRDPAWCRAISDRQCRTAGQLRAIMACPDLAPSRFTDKVPASASRIQMACDTEGLSDTVILICEKGTA